MMKNNVPTALTLLFSLILLFSLTLCPPTTATSSEEYSTMPYGVIMTENVESYDQLHITNHEVGPESIAFDCRGEGPYVGVSNGRILKWDALGRAWMDFAFTSPNRTMACDGPTNPDIEPNCGRPLGLKFNNVTCDLYIADAYFGLLKVGPEGGVAQQLAISADGKPFRFTNALDIDTDTGVVYFTDSSTVYQRREYPKILETFDRSGRFLKYDPCTNKVYVLSDGLFFPNGVALSKDKSFVLVAMGNDLQIHKFWVSGPKVNTSELFAQLWRFPDNIKINDAGDFWVAFNAGRAGRSPRISVPKYHSGGKSTIPLLMRDAVALKFKPDGSLVEIVDGMYGTMFDTVTEVLEHDGVLWFGSIIKPYVLKLKFDRNQQIMQCNVQSSNSY